MRFDGNNFVIQITNNLCFYNVGIKCHCWGKWQPKIVVQALDVVSSEPQAGLSACPTIPDSWPSHNRIRGVRPHSCTSPHRKALRRLSHPPRQLFCSVEAICKNSRHAFSLNSYCLNFLQFWQQQDVLKPTPLGQTHLPLTGGMLVEAHSFWACVVADLIPSLRNNFISVSLDRN